MQNNTLRFISYGIGGLGMAIATLPFIPVILTQINTSIHQQQIAIENELRKSQISEREGLEKHRLQQRASTLQTASAIGEHIEYSTVKVENYTDNPNSPPKLNTKAFKPNEHIQVFDKNGVCIGRIRNQKLEWKRFYLNTCLSKGE